MWNVRQASDGARRPPVRTGCRSRESAVRFEHYAMVYGMLLKHGYQAKRAKHEIATSGKRMAVTKLAANAKPGLSRAERSKIRAIVQSIEQYAALGEKLQFDQGHYVQAMGKVWHLERFHPGEAAPLKNACWP